MNRRALVWVLLLPGCADERIGPDPGPPNPAQSLIVSDPVSAPSSAPRGTATLTSNDPVTYVSLPPGSAPTAVQARIENLRTGSAASTSVVQGGFDPVAIPAISGDTLDVVLTDGNSVVSVSRARVPSRRPPRIVRTSPPKGQNDVPLNAAMVIVFSEPIEGTTLTDATVQLVPRGGAPVAGRLQLRPPDRVVAEFVPVELLVPATDYELVITPGVRDLDGEALEGTVNVEFTTQLATLSQGEIAFQRGYDDYVEILVADADGSHAYYVTDGMAPTWSPDGTKIAFVERRCDYRNYQDGDDFGDYDYYYNCVSLGLTVVIGEEANAVRRVRLTGDPTDQDPAWSPDGSRIAFSRSNPFPSLYVMSANGSVPTLIPLPAAVEGMSPAWSPDGTTLAFTCQFVQPSGPYTDICTVNADGTGFLRLTNTPGGAADRPAWKPDGSEIAFITSGSAGGPPKLAVMSRDGGAVTSFLTPDLHAMDPAWSPDGSKIVFASGSGWLYIVNANGSGLRQLTAWGGKPAWRP